MKTLLALALFAPLCAGAQDLPRNCDLVFTNTPVTRLTLVKLPTGKYNTFSGGGVVGHCASQNNLITADSAEYYEDQGLLYLIGNVHYNETRAKVTSQRMTYFQADDHVHAEGQVVAVFTNGSTMRGPVADYYRATPQRPVARLISPGHPVLDLVQPDTTGKGQPQTAHVLANVIVMEGDSLVYASQDVSITRPDLTAKGDSGFLDNGKEFARLMRGPSVVGRGDRPFTLTGGVIDIFSKNRQVQRVVATPSGHVVSRDLELVADTIDLRLLENQIQRAIAWGKSRAHAISPEREIVADSIDALLPGQRVREVHAVRHAFASSVPDTATIISAERDWMRGDTIVAFFNPVPTGDTTTRPQIKSIVASGSASSFYQMHSTNAPKNRPGANYVRGSRITAAFQTGKVSTVVVTDRAAGVYIEPVTDTTKAGPTGAPNRTAPPAKTPLKPIKR